MDIYVPTPETIQMLTSFILFTLDHLKDGKHYRIGSHLTPSLFLSLVSLTLLCITPFHISVLLSCVFRSVNLSPLSSIQPRF